ncbi:MAG: CAP domain-containing protein [Draconibacterium sp.]|nr:CAP domain-containing protein [Draconibacterium sp.]
MKIWISILFLSIVNLVFAETIKNDRLNTAAKANYLSPIEKEIIYEINLFRSNPAKYATDYIAPLAQYFEGKIIHYPGDKSIRTQEGVSALNECVRILKKASPKPIMYPDRNLFFAARDHQRDQTKTGKTGHTGRDGSDLKERIERYGEWQVRIAENIAYGNNTARQIVIALLIDDGVRSRGHRKNLLHHEFKMVGVAYGKHPVFRTICVMDFAGGMKSR